MGYIKIGTVINTHGLKGELKIRSSSDFDELRYQKGNTVYFYANGEYLPVKPISFRLHSGYSLVSFEGMQDINAVEQYKGCLVCIQDTDRHELDDGEYYADELIGMKAEDEEGHELGTVTAVEETSGAQNNIRIQRPDHSSALIPNVPEFVLEIDEENRIIVIHVEEGLL
ncbi:MAG: ribosome maturation factor RimM [Erysipelotrichia bacterium]|nr:ribosome maturation factor RimM [Erysipelotrichia bacterium]